MASAKDDLFELVEASKLSLDDEFMKHVPKTRNQRIFKRSLEVEIEKGLTDFWHSKLDPSWNEEESRLEFKAGNMPVVDKPGYWWEHAAQEYMPERGSRLGTEAEYIAFLGNLIKSLVKNGWSITAAWKAVCDDSTPLGHCLNAIDAKNSLEPTGSREICGWCDLLNTNKILAWDEKNREYSVVECGYYCFGFFYPLAAIFQERMKTCIFNYGVGWIVLTK